MPHITWQCFGDKPPKQNGELHITQDSDSRFRLVVNQDGMSPGHMGWF